MLYTEPSIQALVFFQDHFIALPDGIFTMCMVPSFEPLRDPEVYLY